MLKKINRGLKRSDFEVSRVSGVMYQTPLFGVSVVNNKLQKDNFQTKIGFVISKKISKKAVDRNKIKRRLSEVIGSRNFKLQTLNCKLIILVKKNILEAKMEEIEACWKMVYEKINSQTTDIL